MTLLDGTSIELSIAEPRDTAAVLAFTRGLSSASRYGRYFSGLGDDAVEHEVRRELHDIRNLSLIARSKLEGRIIGHAFAAPLSSDRVELAFAVDDSVGHHGIGTALLGELLRVLRARGVRHFEAVTLLENRPMREIFVASGFTMLANMGYVHAQLDDAEPPSGKVRS